MSQPRERRASIAVTARAALSAWCRPSSGARKVKERRAGKDLELGGRAELRRNLINGGLQLREQRREVGFRDWPLVDLDPFRVGDEVRLWHQPDTVARRLQDAGEHGADRALAVGPCDVHALKEFVGVAERV